MKLSHLSLAIFSAIALAACGGSGSSTEIKPDPKPDPKPETTTPVKNEEVIVDPAQTGVVGNLNFATESSVGTLQYIRGKKSKYDRIDNPDEATTATSILGVSPDTQNPELTNIALARVYDKKAPGQTKIQFLGTDEDNANEPKDIYSLQQQNKHNVVLDDTKLTKAATVTTKDAIEKQLEYVDVLIDVYEDNADTLSNDQKKVLKNLKNVKEELELVQESFENNEKYSQNRFVFDRNTAYDWGDGIPTSDKVRTYDGTEIKAAADRNKNPAALGLVGINFKQADNRSKPEFTKGRVRGTEELSRSSSRIFGKNFNVDDAVTGVDWNSYLGAEAVVLKDKISNLVKTDIDDVKNAAAGAKLGKADDAVNDNLPVAPAVPVDKRIEEGVEWTLAAVPNHLDYVQYGRVTGNLDPQKFTKKQIEDGEEFVYTRANLNKGFLNKDDAAAVDTYFYRGPNSTTIEQMKEVAAGGAELTYRGHALMYGIDNEFHSKNPGSVPTAFGKTGKYGIGNFVEAKVDLAKERLYDGFVYNVWQAENDHAIVKDALVQFDGNIYGNTVIGEAQRTYKTGDKADFRASFYGKKANELGGSFNSTTWQEKYGAKGDVWGGVFGAKRVVVEDSGLSNQQLGDIPALTAPKKAEEAKPETTAKP